MVLAQSYDDATQYLMPDALGSTRTLTDASGAVVSSYSYDAFGELLDQSGTASTNYRFTGQQFDAETGLYSLRARYYIIARRRLQESTF